jgi:hypothetical protein
LRDNPQRTDRSVARTVGLSPTTVAEIREETAQASNVQTGHSEPPRIEDSGKKPRGRKPYTAAQKAAKFEENKKPRPFANDRDNRVNAMAEQLKGDIAGQVEAFVMVLSGFAGVLEKTSLSRREEWTRKFAKAMGVSLENFSAAA